MKQIHELRTVSSSNWDWSIFVQPASHSFPPQTVFRRVKSISAVISVMSRCSVGICVCACVYLCVMQCSFISSFISRETPSSPDSRCLFSFFPYFHTRGATHASAFSLSLLHTDTNTHSLCTHSQLNSPPYGHLCKQMSHAQVYKERNGSINPGLLIVWLIIARSSLLLIGLLFPDSKVD